jgi:hypothetical protein
MQAMRALAAAIGTVVLAASAAVAQSDMSSDAQMARAAAAFLATLTDEQRALAEGTLEEDVTRDAWSNLPAAMVPRDGVATADLTDAQRIALHELLAASLSAQGYMKAAQIMWADDILHAMGEDMAASIRARGGEAAADRFAPIAESWSTLNYWTKVYGDPESDRWAWSVNGHHLALVFTVVEGKLAFTPMFLGAEPEVVQAGRYAGFRVLPQEAQRGLELMQSLDDEQRAAALLSPEVDSAAFIGAGRKGREGEPRGLAGDALDAEQQTLLWALVEEYVRNADHDAAEAWLTRLRADGVAALRFSWMGPHGSARDRYYYRVHGPSIVIDYMREGGVGGGAANHIHTIVRDPRNDYGEDWLGRHYAEAHARGDGPPRRGPAD